MNRGPFWMSSRVLCAGTVLFLMCGCASSARGVAQAPKSGDVIDAPTQLISGSSAESAEDALRHADEHLANERFAEAAREYRRITEHVISGDERRRALFGWGTALDLSGDVKGAFDVYSRYASEAEDGPLRETVRVRIVRLYVYQRDYEKAAKVASQVQLARRSPSEQVALFAALALDLLDKGRKEEAQRVIARGRSVMEDNQLDRVSVPSRDVASLYFALGELRRHEAEAIVFDPFPEEFAVALEERCQWILDAQNAYSSAMRSHDAHWSAMAGVQVAQLYHELHKALMSMPAPPQADSDERRKLLEGALRLRYGILLSKAAAMLRATVSLVERTDSDAVWAARARRALLEIEKAHQREQEVIDALPYTRAQLQQVLDEMMERARKLDHSDQGQL